MARKIVFSAKVLLTFAFCSYSIHKEAVKWKHKQQESYKNIFFFYFPSFFLSNLYNLWLRVAQSARGCDSGVPAIIQP